MIRNVVLFIAALLASPAQACTCFPPLNNQSVRVAKNIFVFRFVGSELQSDGADAAIALVLGNMIVVENLRGETKATRFTYSTQWCCGIRLDVGKYYAAFVAEDDSAQFSGTNANLLELGDSYNSQTDGAKLRTIVSGKKKLEAVFDQSQIDRIEQVPRPPPPDPKDKKAVGKRPNYLFNATVMCRADNPAPSAAR